jgi:hypothetical protein
MLGIRLTAKEQAVVLAAFTKRYTEEHIPKWVKSACLAHPVQFSSDKDWLEHTRFVVYAEGYLDTRAKWCESSPTWPRNPELRAANQREDKGNAEVLLDRLTHPREF